MKPTMVIDISFFNFFTKDSFYVRPYFTCLVGRAYMQVFFLTPANPDIGDIAYVKYGLIIEGELHSHLSCSFVQMFTYHMYLYCDFCDL